ncbi:MAG: hypothetical protein WDZ59_16065 [Pirellulales bacterium]
MPVPSLREIRTLPTVEHEAAPQRAAWSRKQGIVLLLGAVALAGGVVGAVLWLTAPEVIYRSPDALRVHVKEYVQGLTPAESYHDWVDNVRDQGLTDEKSLTELYLLDRRATLHRLAYTSWVIAAVAAVIAAVVALAVPSRSGNRSNPPKRI